MGSSRCDSADREIGFREEVVDSQSEDDGSHDHREDVETERAFSEHLSNDKH